MLVTRLLLCAAVLLTHSFAQPAAVQKKADPNEQRAARYFDSIKNDPVALRSFLYAMPKGGDLHNHLSGAIYAEGYIKWAAEDSLCIDTRALMITEAKEPCDAAKGHRAAKEAHADPEFYAALIDGMSVRNHHPARRAGEYQFFDAFPRFGPPSVTRRGDMLVEVARRAAAQSILYLELTSTWDLQVPLATAAKVQWTDDLPDLHQRLLDAGLRQAPKNAQLDAAVKRMQHVLHCGTKDADAGCSVTIRYHAEALRAFTPVEVFSMLVWSFEQNQGDPRFVGINMVQQEDWHVPVRDYDLHMKMVEYLHGKYPKVNIALHAGELTLGQVPPEVLGTHIPKAIDQGHAQRVGHGTDIIYYPHPRDLMEEMKLKNVAVEVSLSSSDYILGVRGERHPLSAYVKAGVPVVIATDDEGVARSDLTNEYVRAVLEHGLTYQQLKKISRDSLEHAFVGEQTRKQLLKRLDVAFVKFEKTPTSVAR